MKVYFIRIQINYTQLSIEKIILFNIFIINEFKGYLK